MKRTLPLLALAIAGGLPFASIASAQWPEDGPPPPIRPGMMFETLDMNKDGFVTRAEAKAAAEQRFDAADTDRNGTISDAEREAARAAMHRKMASAMFDRLDTDRNGQISRDEFIAGRPGMQDKGGPGRHHRGMMPDGEATRTQATERALAMFDRVDANRDGKITSAERDAFASTMRARLHDRHSAPDE